MPESALYVKNKDVEGLKRVLSRIDAKLRFQHKY